MTTHLCTFVKNRKISMQKCFINVRNFRILINKFDLVVNHIYTLPPKLSSVIKKFRSGSIFCVFASVALILMGKDDECENFGLKVRSHQARMKRCAQIIYMLSQCKDAIDNPASLFA